jgi:hypothetical protein
MDDVTILFQDLSAKVGQQAEDSVETVHTNLMEIRTPKTKFSPVETPKRKDHTINCDNCSICWSPLCKPVTLFTEVQAEENIGIKETEDAIEEPKTYTDQENLSDNHIAQKINTTQTKCGHTFHTKCLLETKLRKAECPNCRCALTPITDPLHVSTAMYTDPTLFTSSLRDAVIHAAHRGRNAVRAAMQAREAERERQRIDANETLICTS